MQTLIFILILFLITIFSVLLYFKSKTTRVEKLLSGECPSCGQKAKVFFDEKTNTTFKSEIIKSNILKNHGCSGVNDVEFSCEVCGNKEVHSTQLPAGCHL
jgi:DNA-directed RNA polymerase subunit M/transcription elongation factor TFIIS